MQEPVSYFYPATAPLCDGWIVSKVVHSISCHIIFTYTRRTAGYAGLGEALRAARFAQSLRDRCFSTCTWLASLAGSHIRGLLRSQLG